MNKRSISARTPMSPEAVAGIRAGDSVFGNTQAQTIDPKDAKVLIVDDMPANLDLLRDMLKPLGSQIFFATSGAMALDIAKNAQPDLILLAQGNQRPRDNPRHFCHRQDRGGRPRQGL